MSLKKLVFATVGSVFFITQVSAQVYGSKNQWEFEQLNGLQRVLWDNRIPFTPYMENTVEQSVTLGLNYLRALSPNFQVVSGFSLGSQSHTQKTYFVDIVNSFGKSVPLKSKWFNQIFQVKLGLKYSQKVNEKTYFSVAFNYGLHWGNSTYWTYVFPIGDNFSMRGYGKSGINITGFLQVMPEYQFILKNKDILSVKLGIQLFNESHIQGIYYPGVYEPYPLNYNTYKSERGNFQFGIGYTLSRVRKLEKIDALKMNGESPLRARKLLRKARQAHNDNASFTGLQFGVGLPRLDMSDANQMLRNIPIANFAVRANFEKGMKRGLFVEVGYHFMEYQLSYGFSNTSFSLASSTNLFYTHQLTGGGGYRLKIRETPIANIHAGLNLGAVLGAVYFYDEPQEYFYSNEVLNIEKQSEMKSRIFGGAYLGLSKDIHLTNRFMLTLNYRYQQGFATISEHLFNYSGTQYNGNQEAVGRLRGTESTYTIGLKYRFLMVNKSQKQQILFLPTPDAKPAVDKV